MNAEISPIINVSELLKLYKSENLLIVDARSGKDAKSNYEAKHLDGAVFIDLNTQLADVKDDVAIGGRHPLPSIETFASTLSDLGISKNSHVIIYDDKNGSIAASRFWWMLKSIGHKKVQVLNGGIQEAERHHFPMSSEAVSIHKAETYKVDKWNLLMAEMEEVENVSQLENHIVIDVREPIRYRGEMEPIDLIAGHIPRAINIPFSENLDENGLFLSPQELKLKYEKAIGSIKSQDIIVHCGSGVTACHTLLAMSYAGLEIPKLYVGSWSEWSRNEKEVVSEN